MVKWKTVNAKLKDRGDTLIEVTFALTILGFVLLSSTAIAATAFRTGQTARERTQVSEAAQEQMEALRSFRDNHTWAQFRAGSSCGASGGYCGVDQVLTTPCNYNPAVRCFHMAPTTIGATTEWLPVAGSVASTVPTSILEISTGTSGVDRPCGYDFALHYAFTPLGGGANKAQNQITTRLVNLKYDPGIGLPACP